MLHKIHISGTTSTNANFCTEKHPISGTRICENSVSRGPLVNYTACRIICNVFCGAFNPAFKWRAYCYDIYTVYKLQNGIEHCIEILFIIGSINDNRYDAYR